MSAINNKATSGDNPVQGDFKRRVRKWQSPRAGITIAARGDFRRP